MACMRSGVRIPSGPPENEESGDFSRSLHSSTTRKGDDSVVGRLLNGALTDVSSVETKPRWGDPGVAVADEGGTLTMSVLRAQNRSRRTRSLKAVAMVLAIIFVDPPYVERARANLV